MYDLTTAAVTFLVIAGIAAAVAVLVLVRVLGDLLAERARVAVPVRLEQPLTERRAA